MNEVVMTMQEWMNKRDRLAREFETDSDSFPANAVWLLPDDYQPRLSRGTVHLPPNFWARVDIRTPDECWEWRRGRSVAGYGHLHDPASGKTKIASRIALEWSMGRALLSDEEARHVCDNPPCVNPGHLLDGSRSDNQKDAVIRGRWSNGNKNKTSCKRGHDFTESNTRINTRGQRVCRACDREIQRKRRSK